MQQQATLLTPQLAAIENDNTPAIKGALEALFEAHLPPATAEKYAEALIDNGYDTVGEIRLINSADLEAVGILRGHRRRVGMAIFNGRPAPDPVQIPQFQPVGAPGEQAVVQHVQMGAQPKWERDLPSSPDPIKMMEVGLALRSHLRSVTTEAYANLVFERFTNPWTDIPADFAHGNAEDKVLVALLLKREIPDWARGLIQTQIKEDRGLQAVQILCRQAFAVTDVSDTAIKAASRTPGPCARAKDAALALAKWDGDVSACLSRGFALDDHDKRTAQYGIVGHLNEFKAIVAQLKSARPTPTPQVIRDTLGLIADELALPNVAASPKKAKAAKVKKQRKQETDKKVTGRQKPTLASKAQAMLAELEGSGWRTVQRKKGPKAAQGKRQQGRGSNSSAAAPAERQPICIFFRDGGWCREGDKCPYSHDLASASDKDKVMAAVARLLDGASPAAWTFLLTVLPLVQSKKVKAATLLRLLDLTQSRASARRGFGGPNEAACAVERASCPIEAVHNKVDTGRSSHQLLPALRANGALVDGGADESFIGANDAAEAVGERPADPRPVDTASGMATVEAKADLPRARGLMDSAYLLPCSKDSLCSVGKVCERTGAGYTVDPGNAGARFWHPDHDGFEVECEPDGRLFRLPDDVPNVPWLDGFRAMMASLPSWYPEHAAKGHPYRPDCDHCRQGRMRRRMARRLKAKMRSRKKGYVASADFTGQHAEDIDGNVVALVMCVYSFKDPVVGDEVVDEEAEAAFCFSALLPDRKAERVAEVLDRFDVELRSLGQDKDRQIIQFHTDVDKSFMGAVKKLAIRKGWFVTDTGGYRSQSNSIAERRIGMIKQSVRTVLLAATGGLYYEQLWGPAFMFAADATNRNDWRQRKAPYTQLTGKPYEYSKDDHAFGTYCTWGVPRQVRDGEYRPAGEKGIWLRRRADVPHGDVVAPIEYDADTKAWLIGNSTTVTDCHVHDGVMPLRMKPGKGADPTAFDSFIDAVFEPLLDSAAKEEERRSREGMEADTDYASSDEAGSGSEPPADLPSEGESEALGAEGVYEVERILNSRLTKGKRFFLVKWKGWGRKDATWEPAANLHCDELIAEYEGRLEDVATGGASAAAKLSRVSYERDEQLLWSEQDVYFSHRAYSVGPAVQGPLEAPGLLDKDDAFKAIAQLQRQQRVSGSAADWLPGYLTELEAVGKLRLRELPPEQAAVVRRTHLVPKLRMILEEKRDGRRKGRLILQGFAEPYAWDCGRSNASPVAYMGSIRAFLATRRKGDRLSGRDVSVAFLQSDAYADDEQDRYVSYKAHKRAVERIFKLLGPLYGQRSASRRWYETLTKWLLRQGFEQGVHEPCLFRHPETGVQVLLYVDDLLVKGSDVASAGFHAALGRRFECKDETYLTVDTPLEFLGFQIELEVVEGETAIYMTQQDAMVQFLSQFERNEIPPKTSPMPTRQLFHSNGVLLTDNAAALYKHVVSVLNYFARVTRFDIAYATSRLSTKMASPDEGAWKSLKHLLGYLANTTSFRIGGVIEPGACRFDFYVDSDHASDRQTDTRSQTGYLLFLNDFPVEWASRKQLGTAVAPAEAEVYAMHDAAKAGKLCQWVAEEMGLPVKWPFELKTDSSQADSFQRITTPNSKMRGCFELRYASMGELRDCNMLRSKKIPRDLNVADLLTHCLSGPAFRECLGRAQNLRSNVCRAACVFKHIYSYNRWSHDNRCDLIY